MKTISRLFFTFLFGISLAMLALLAARGHSAAAPDAPQNAIRYVATTGSDTTDCTDSANPCATIQYAVDQAEAGDEVRVAGGEYTDTHIRPRNDITTTGVVTQVVYLSKSIHIQGGYTFTNWVDSDPMGNPTILNSQGKGRVIYLTGAISPTLEGLQIAGGYVPGVPYVLTDIDSGGGLYVITATLTLSNCQIYSNTAKKGGAMYLLNSPSVIINNQIYDNTTFNEGNIYLNSSRATLKDNTIFSNTANLGGGLLLSQSDATIVGNQIVSNTASIYGGGIYINSSTVTLQFNEISGNRATNDGGGIFILSSLPTILSNTLILNTSSDWGGAIAIRFSEGNIVGNQISENSSVNRGGGISLEYGSVTLERNRFFLNASTTGGGLYSTDSQVIFDGNQFITNTATNRGGGFFFYSGNSSTFVNNLFSGNTANNGGGGVYFSNCDNQIINNNTFIRNFTAAGGGGGYFYCSVSLYDNRFIENTAHDGGGFTLGGNSTASRNTIVYNIALPDSTTGYGGGVVVIDPVILDSNIILHNTANQTGGGLYIKSNPILINNLIADNQAGVKGAGIYIFDGYPTLLHNTIARNQGPTGIHSDQMHIVGTTIKMIDNIIVGHTVGLHIGPETRVDFEATLWGTSIWANNVDWEGEGIINVGAINVWGNPGFIAPDIGDYHISFESDAVDAGVNANVTTDFDGETRPSRLTFDIGADEYIDPSLQLSKKAQANLVSAGSPVTYTILITNTGSITLHTVVTDILPGEVSPTGNITWTSTLAPGDVWEQTVLVMSSEDYTGDILNKVFASTNEGPAGAAQDLVTIINSPTYCFAKLNNEPTIYPSIQNAIDASSLSTDIVKIGGYCDEVNTFGGLSQIVYLTKSLSLQGGWNEDFTAQNVISYPTTLDAHRTGRGIYIAGGITVTIEGVHIIGGDSTGLGGAPGFTNNDAGGGIYITQASVIISNTSLQNNFSADHGGGIYVYQGNIQVYANQIKSNQSKTNGAGIYIDSAVGTSIIAGNEIVWNESEDTFGLGGGIYTFVSNVVIFNNQIKNNIAGNGGGIYSTGASVTIEDNMIETNFAYALGGAVSLNSYLDVDATITGNIIRANSTLGEGGGIYIGLNSPTNIENNFISDNQAGTDGGGIFWMGGTHANIPKIIQNNWVVKNSAIQKGGGIYLLGADALMTNNIVAENQAGISGGGLFVLTAKPDLYHTTFVRNQSGDGTGIYITNQVGNSISNVEMFNSIIVGHTIGIFITPSNVAHLESTLWGSGTWANGVDWQGGGTISTGTINIWDSPDFVDPILGDYHINDNSAAINAGIDVGVATDIDGEQRPIGAGFDIGADEFGIVFAPSGLVQLQGRDDASGAVVTAWSGGTIVATNTTDSSGAYLLTLPDGTYTLTIEMPLYLDARKTNVTIANSSPFSLVPVTLKGGDVNDSDTINILDLAIIGAHYDMTCGDPDWDPRADINGDCEVNLLDLVLAAGNFGRSSPLPWD